MFTPICICRKVKGSFECLNSNTHEQQFILASFSSCSNVLSLSLFILLQPLTIKKGHHWRIKCRHRFIHFSLFVVIFFKANPSDSQDLPRPVVTGVDRSRAWWRALVITGVDGCSGKVTHAISRVGTLAWGWVGGAFQATRHFQVLDDCQTGHQRFDGSVFVEGQRSTSSARLVKAGDPGSRLVCSAPQRSHDHQQRAEPVQGVQVWWKEKKGQDRKGQERMEQLRYCLTALKSLQFYGLWQLCRQWPRGKNAGKVYDRPRPGQTHPTLGHSSHRLRMFMLNFSTSGRMTGQTRPKVLMLKIQRTVRWDNDAELPWRRAPVVAASCQDGCHDNRPPGAEEWAEPSPREHQSVRWSAQKREGKHLLNIYSSNSWAAGRTMEPRHSPEAQRLVDMMRLENLSFRIHFMVPWCLFSALSASWSL